MLDRKSLRIKHFSGVIALSVIICGCTLTSVKRNPSTILSGSPFVKAYTNIKNVKINPKKISSDALEKYVALEFKDIRNNLSNRHDDVVVKNYIVEKKTTKKINVADVKIRIFGKKVEKVAYKNLKLESLKDNEINSNELVVHTGFAVNVEKVADVDNWSKYLSEYSKQKDDNCGKLEETKLININEDKKILTAALLPVVEKNTAIEDNIEEIVENDDQNVENIEDLKNNPLWSMMDTHNVKQLKDRKVEKNLALSPLQDNLSEISKSVKVAIDREMNKYNPKIKKDSLSTQMSSQKKRVNNVPGNLNTELAYNNNVSKNQKIVNFFQEAIESDNNPKLTISPYLVNLGVGILEDITDFEFRPHYEYMNEIFDGPISVDLNSGMGVISGTVSARKVKQTNINISIVSNVEKQEYPMPLITEDSFEKFLKEKNLLDSRGFVLVDIAYDIDSIDVESIKKFNFDVNFKEVDYKSKYVLFVVEPGLLPLRYILSNGEVLTKDVLVEEDQLLFELSGVAKNKVVFETLERNVAGDRPIKIQVDENSVADFYSNKKANAFANFFNFGELTTPSGRRQYTKFTHLGKPLIVGKWNEQKVYLPAREWGSMVYEKLNIDNLNNMCLVELNFSKSPKEIYVNGRAFDGNIGLERLYRDDDGRFFEEISEETKSGYFLGSNEGVIDIKVEYVSGKADYLQTYCYADSYLIEHL